MSTEAEICMKSHDLFITDIHVWTAWNESWEETERSQINKSIQNLFIGRGERSQFLPTTLRRQLDPIPTVTEINNEWKI